MPEPVKPAPETGDGKPPAAPVETVEQLKAQLAERDTKLKDAEGAKHAANEEAKKSRLDAKEAKTKADRFEKAWKVANGEEADAPDPAKLEKDKMDKRLRNLSLKSAFVSVAASEMHDAEFSFDAVASEFNDVSVDLDSGKVDKAAVKATLDKIKKEKPFLFKVAANGGAPPPKDPPGPPDGGQPNNGENPWTKWQALLKTNPSEAQKFYVANRAAIGTNMPK